MNDKNNNQKMLVVSHSYSHEELESLILAKDTEFKEEARRNAIHFASKNLPALEGDDILTYTFDTKTKYEQLASFAYQKLQPASHIPEGKMQIHHAREKEKRMDAEILEKENLNKNELFKIPNYDPDNVPSRIRKAWACIAVIFAGELVFNMASFQVIGEKMIAAVILSFSVSAAVSFFSHMTASFYKKTEDKEKKRLILIGAFIAVTAFFIVLAVLRSKLLEKHDVHIHPAFFVIFNLFLFSVCTALAIYYLPSLAEIERHKEQLKIWNAVQKRKNEIEQLKKEKEDLKTGLMEKAAHHLKVPLYAESLADRIRKMYRETVGIFKSTNLIHRTDNGVPSCFREEIPEPDINFFVFNSQKQ